MPAEKKNARGRWIVWISALLFLASQAHLGWLVSPLKPNLLAAQLAFTPEAYWHVLSEWGATGLAIYASHFVYDSVHPLIYGAFGYLLVSRTKLFDGLGAGAFRAVLYALPLAAALDYAENFIQLFLISQPPGTGSFLVPLSASCSLLKWLLALAFLMVAGIRVIRALKQGKASLPVD